jgi:Tol biopolymer transport system component
MIRWDGSDQIRVTSSSDSESQPRWSPDGKHLSCVAARGTVEE